MALSGVVSEIYRNICADSQFSPTLPSFDARGGEPRQNFPNNLWYEKLERWSYQIVKNVLR